jgi:hypothetical protein
LQALGGAELWVARLNYDLASAIAVDSAGNSFVTGWICASVDQFGDCTDFGWETVKYDTNGNVLWTASFDAVGASFPSAIAVDAFGNAYVTGSICVTNNCEEGCVCYYSAYGTIKYDPNGAQLWLASSFGGVGDAAEAIAVDPNGNVYITGLSYDGFTPHYATLKYDSNGNEIWVARYNGPGNGPDYAAAVGLDPAGNVYVTGGSAGVGTSYDYATIKYDPAGNQLWVARYDGPASGDDAAVGLAVSSLGNVYVTGQSLGTTTSNDYATIKYDPNGNQLWVARYDGPASGDDFATAIALSSDEHVHVTGASPGSGTNPDYATIQYDSDGNEIWVARYNGPGNSRDWPHAIALDAAGSVYVTGESEGLGTGLDYATIKYSPQGATQWVDRYDGPGHGDDVAYAVAVDPSGNVYVTGASSGGFATLKLLGQFVGPL